MLPNGVGKNMLPRPAERVLVSVTQVAPKAIQGLLLCNILTGSCLEPIGMDTGLIETRNDLLRRLWPLA